MFCGCGYVSKNFFLANDIHITNAVYTSSLTLTFVAHGFSSHRPRESHRRGGADVHHRPLQKD